jgi:hypothetical protein
MLNLPLMNDPPVSPRPVVSRFTIAILAILLCGASVGRVLTPEVATMCGFTGLTGFTGYLALNLSARARSRQRSETLKTSAEYRLLAHAVPAFLPAAAAARPSDHASQAPALAYDGGGWMWLDDSDTTS